MVAIEPGNTGSVIHHVVIDCDAAGTAATASGNTDIVLQNRGCHHDFTGPGNAGTGIGCRILNVITIGPGNTGTVIVCQILSVDTIGPGNTGIILQGVHVVIDGAELGTIGPGNTGIVLQGTLGAGVDDQVSGIDDQITGIVDQITGIEDQITGFVDQLIECCSLLLHQCITGRHITEIFSNVLAVDVGIGLQTTGTWLVDRDFVMVHTCGHWLLQLVQIDSICFSSIAP